MHEQIDQMIAMHARGHSTRAIGSQFGMAQSSARRHLKQSGVDLGSRRHKLEITEEYVSMTREMRNQGMTWEQISEKMGFSIRQLQKRLYSK